LTLIENGPIKALRAHELVSECVNYASTRTEP